MTSGYRSCWYWIHRVISRELHGLPDDFTSRFYNTKGWLHTNTGTRTVNFNVANDNSSATYPDESADAAYISSNFPDSLDTEPDITDRSAADENGTVAWPGHGAAAPGELKNTSVCALSECLKK